MDTFSAAGSYGVWIDQFNIYSINIPGRRFESAGIQFFGKNNNLWDF